MNIFGACTNFMEPLQFMIGTSTDKYNWVNFLLKIEEELER